MSTLAGIWVEKYRPKTLNDIALNEEIKQLLRDYAKNDEIPNLLLVGRPGIGKTSLARIVISELLECQHLYINASEENGIDTVRGIITSFAQTKSLDGKIKIILLDEVDGFTMQGQQALRNLMEAYSGNTRFILTANQLHRVIPAIQSRCQSLQVECSIYDAMRRCVEILKLENIKVSGEDKNHVMHLIKSCFPDIRKAINSLQRACASGEFLQKESKSSNMPHILHAMILNKKSCTDVRKYVIESEDSFSSDYPGLMRSLLNITHHDEDIKEEQKRVLICILAEHLYRSAFVMDQEINAFHCMINMINAIT